MTRGVPLAYIVARMSRKTDMIGPNVRGLKCATCVYVYYIIFNKNSNKNSREPRGAVPLGSRVRLMMNQSARCGLAPSAIVRSVRWFPPSSGRSSALRG